MNPLFYESEIQELLLIQSKKQYGLEIKTDLIPYLFRRYYLIHLNKNQIRKMTEGEWPALFMTFWLEDLAIPIEDHSFRYKETAIPVTFRVGSVFHNIYHNLLHEISSQQVLRGDEVNSLKEWFLARQDMVNLLKRSKRKWLKHTGTRAYTSLIKKTCLDELNNKYQAVVSSPSMIDGIHYSDFMYPLSAEEQYERYILAANEITHDSKLISESKLEEYIISHIDDVEKGMKVIQSQVVLKNGRIDILAKDKNGTYSIIELKVEKDTDLMWQKWYYTKEIKERYHLDHVRFIVILPQFYPELIESILQDKTPTKVLQFHPTIQRGTLLDVTFTDYQNSQ